MTEIKLSRYDYFPALRTRQAEIKGLLELDDERKNHLLPIITLGQWRGDGDLTKSANKAVEAMGERPFLMDLTSDSRNALAHWQSLKDPSNNFHNWRDFASKFKSAIPVIQFSDDSKTRDIVKQAQLIELFFGKTVFRLQNFQRDLPWTISAISAMDDPNNAIVFIDFQFIRGAEQASKITAISLINKLRSEFPSIFIITLATSFPSSVIPFSNGQSKSSGQIEILEREFHQSIGGNSVAAYGDHGSIHSVVYDDSPVMRWSPRIDYPDYSSWYFERRPQPIISNEQGYIDCAKAICSNFDLTRSNTWGERMIQEAAAGSPYAKAPASWIAVRVNIHLARQVEFNSAMMSEEDDEF